MDEDWNDEEKGCVHSSDYSPKFLQAFDSLHSITPCWLVIVYVQDMLEGIGESGIESGTVPFDMRTDVNYGEKL
jgi:hypothetical protein